MFSSKRKDTQEFRFSSESGISLVELLVAITLMSIAIVGITSMLMMTMRTQDTINAGFRSQLDTRKVLYDMELQVSESKKSAANGQYAIFQADAISVPTQEGNWVTYEYVTPPGESSPTLMRVFTANRPASLPVTPSSSDTKLINVGTNSDITTAVNRASPSAPIFRFYGSTGSAISAPVSNTRNVRSIKVEFSVTESKGHAEGESTVSSTQINLRNY
ncbi:MAG: prepilin-type N-terminal cleavage/methylation domain-containing protein [Thermoleophilia bacterium]|nr:prepilin-type N-terminal cleavage/methylation domain-containing protein [Thermoleophilia bacterium]